MDQITDTIIAYYPIWFLFWCALGFVLTSYDFIFVFYERRRRPMVYPARRRRSETISLIAGLSFALSFAPFLLMIYLAAPPSFQPKLRAMGIVLFLIIPLLFIYLLTAKRKA